MRAITALVCVWVTLIAAPSGAVSLSDGVLAEMAAADVVILGEVHDNPTHHAVQAEAVAALKPRAVVWEMLTELAAARVDAALIESPDRMAQVLEWADSGWPAFEMYAPIFAAAPDARVFGGNVPREAARAALAQGAAVAFGADAAQYGLTVPLPDDEQAAREAAQAEAHCNALPAAQMGGMVEIQRLRDAVLARAALKGLDETGGPVVVITGNGHARRDWGIPVYLGRLRPGLRVYALGQSEAGAGAGDFDTVLDGPAVARDDPCAAFRSGD